MAYLSIFDINVSESWEKLGTQTLERERILGAGVQIVLNLSVMRRPAPLPKLRVAGYSRQSWVFAGGAGLTLCGPSPGTGCLSSPVGTVSGEKRLWREEKRE